MKKAFITGITGQDGAYLAQLLLEKGYQVHGLKRRSSTFNTSRIDHLLFNEDNQPNNRIILHHGDMIDGTNIFRLIKEIHPDEIYNLGAQSHVAVSFETPEYTAQADALGTLRILEALRILDMTKSTKFYQASTSELFGNATEIPQKETTPFAPRSPYAAAKLYAYWITKNYRQAYDIFACNGILFNHESPVRGETFVTRKITRAVAHIFLGMQDCLYLGNLDAQRDWGYAKDYVYAMWLMLQHNEPLDLIIATGQTHSVREFVTLAFNVVGIHIEWHKNGIHEVGINKNNGKTIIRINPRYFRPTDIDMLVGDASKARSILGWKPTISFSELVTMMVSSDVALAQKTQPQIRYSKTTPTATHFQITV